MQPDAGPTVTLTCRRPVTAKPTPPAVIAKPAIVSGPESGLGPEAQG